MPICPKEYSKLFELFVKRLTLASLFHPFDENLSIDQSASVASYSQTYVVGNNWKRLGDPLHSGMIVNLSIELSKKERYAASEVVVPFEEVKKAFEASSYAQHHDWSGGKFSLGAYGVRFWDSTADNPRGCKICEHGVLAFTGMTRWKSWADLFGADFVRAFKENKVGSIAASMYASEKAYYAQRDDSNWVALDSGEMTRFLKCRGLSATAPKGVPASDIDNVLNYLKMTADRQVVAAIPFPHWKERVVEWNGKKYLNTASAELMQPGEVGEFPWLQGYFARLFPDEYSRRHFLAEIQYWYKTALSGAPARGHVMFLAGPGGTGKTFLSFQILGRIFGGSAVATPVFTGELQFSHELFEKAVWAIDDCEKALEGRTHTRFTGAIKATAANPSLPSNKKFGYAGDMPFHGRLIITLNDDPTSLSVLPDITSTILDKVCFYKLGSEKMESWSEEQLMDELPKFLRWLMVADLNIEKETRFGIVPFHDLDVKTSALENSYAYNVLGVVNHWRTSEIELHHDAGHKTKWNKTLKASELAKILNTCETVKGMLGRSISPVGLGRICAAAAKNQWVDWIEAKRTCDGSVVTLIEK